MLLSMSVFLILTPACAVRYGVGASHGMLVYTPALAGTKLYCLVTAHGCEQLAQGCYSTAQQPVLELATTESLV